MKKILAIILVAIFALALTACSAKPADPVSDTPASSVTAGTEVDANPTSSQVSSKPTSYVASYTSSKKPVSSSSKQQSTQNPASSQPSKVQQTTPSSATQGTQAPVKNEFFNDGNHAPDINSVSIKPRHVYWDNGKLVAQCFVINGCNYPVYNLNVKSLVFANSQVQIADGGFGYMQSNGQNISIAANSYVLWTFTFSGDAVTTANSDLGHLICDSNVNYQY